ncbi:thioesterase family protein [Streptomyces stramineus]
MALLRKPAGEPIDAGTHLNGFGGFHGGLALALLTSAMRGEAAGLPLQSVTARFDRPIGAEFRVETSKIRAGRSITVCAARAVSGKGIHVDATAVHGTPAPSTWQPFAPAAPVAPPPEECEIFAIPPEFVPISAYMEIRPVGTARPYSGGAEPELTAWIRLLGDEEPPDTARFIFLMDALAPSYAAVLSTLAAVPTVELTVRPSANLVRAASPWILLRATTRSASADGWVDEQLDAWGPDGTHLGSARQLRVVRAG